jgi:hypothetical protein
VQIATRTTQFYDRVYPYAAIVRNLHPMLNFIIFIVRQREIRLAIVQMLKGRRLQSAAKLSYIRYQRSTNMKVNKNNNNSNSSQRIVIAIGVDDTPSSSSDSEHNDNK